MRGVNKILRLGNVTLLFGNLLYNSLSKDKLLDKYKEALGPVNYVTSLSSVKAAFQLRSVGIENRHEIDTISKKISYTRNKCYI